MRIIAPLPHAPAKALAVLLVALCVFCGLSLADMQPSEIEVACNSLARMAFDLKDLVNVVTAQRNPGPFQVRRLESPCSLDSEVAHIPAGRSGRVQRHLRVVSVQHLGHGGLSGGDRRRRPAARLRSLLQRTSLHMHRRAPLFTKSTVLTHIAPSSSRDCSSSWML